MPVNRAISSPAGGRRAATLCVFCGSARGVALRHAENARRLGGACAAAGVALVTGGGKGGLMGAVADAALAAGGRVTGVIPDFFRKDEILHPGLDEAIVVPGMHARKHRMFALADAFVALPGGPGTLDETVEILTWRYLGLHGKPVMVFDSDYWLPLLALFDHMSVAGFVRETWHGLCEPVDDIGRVVDRTKAAAAVRVPVA